MTCAYVSTSQDAPVRCNNKVAPGKEHCLFHVALICKELRGVKLICGAIINHVVGLRCQTPVSDWGDRCAEHQALNILPADDGDEVSTIAAMPLVGAIPNSPPASPAPKRYDKHFVGEDRSVLNGEHCVAVATSHTMAKRIANALNAYAPGRKGY